MSMRKHTSATYKSVKHKKKLMCQAGTYSPHSNGQTQKVIKEKFLNFQFLVDSLQDPEFAILAILNNKLWFIQYTIVVEASHNQVSFIKNILVLLSIMCLCMTKNKFRDISCPFFQRMSKKNFLSLRQNEKNKFKYFMCAL